MAKYPFWAQVDVKGPDECWEWNGTRTKGGYGATNRHGLRTTAHRMAYIYAYGQLNECHVVMHKCDNRACCNPAHLESGTQQENILDMHKKGRAGDCRNFGERHGRCKVPDSVVERIRQEYSTGCFSQSGLATMHGLGQSHISRIIRLESRASK